jgi:hypothetical protein
MIDAADQGPRLSATRRVDSDLRQVLLGLSSPSLTNTDSFIRASNIISVSQLDYHYHTVLVGLIPCFT